MLINPNKALSETSKPFNRKILGETLARRLSENITVDGESYSVAQAISNRLIDIALFAESNKDATSAAKLIFDRVEGRAAIQQEEEKEVIPAVTFRLHTNDQKKIENLAHSVTKVEEEPTDKIVVEIDGEPRMEF